MPREADLLGGCRFPDPASHAEPDVREVEVNVIFTRPRDTLAALETARGLASEIGAQIRVLVAQVVPYPLPLDKPPVPVAFTERRFDALASNAAPETRVQVCLCRDRWQTLRDFIRPGSLLVIGGKKRWWPTPEQRLARRLKAEGHQVVFTVPPGEATSKQSSKRS